MHPLETFLWGFLGSAAVEIMSLFGFYTTLRGRLPSRYRKVGFWVTRFVLALVAGAIAVAYEIDQRILAFNIGAATPLIVTFMAKGLRQAPLDTQPPMTFPERADREPKHENPANVPPASRSAHRSAKG
jgi:hypothetical protein